MEVVEDTLPVPLPAFLDRRLSCFLAQRGEGPRVSPLWYLWDDGAFWVVGDGRRSYVDRAREDPAVALAVVDFDPGTGRFQHVGVRGRVAVRPLDRDRADRLLARYLGPDREGWDPRFSELDPDRWRLLRVAPDTVVARDQSFDRGPGDATGAGLARSYYRALDGDDYEALRALLAPGFRQDRPDRTIEGRETFVRFMRDQRPERDTTHDIEAVRPGPGGVAVEGELRHADGSSWLAFVDVFEVAGDRIARLRTYAD